MSNDHSAWNDVQRLVDELEVQMHLAGMDARDRWHELKPRFEKLEHQIVQSGDLAGKAVTQELHGLRDALRALSGDLYMRAHGDFTRGW